MPRLAPVISTVFPEISIVEEPFPKPKFEANELTTKPQGMTCGFTNTHGRVNTMNYRRMTCALP
jgi:hypothetical protein